MTDSLPRIPIPSALVARSPACELSIDQPTTMHGHAVRRPPLARLVGFRILWNAAVRVLRLSGAYRRRQRA